MRYATRPLYKNVQTGSIALQHNSQNMHVESESNHACTNSLLQQHSLIVRYLQKYLMRRRFHFMAYT